MDDREKKLVAEATRVEEFLRSDRASAEYMWQEIYDFLLPGKATFKVRVSEGVYRDADLLDSTGARALEQFASYLFSTLNNPASKWVDVVPTGPRATREFLAKRDVQKAREDVAHAVKDFLATSGRVYETLHEAYFGLGAIGQATTAQELTQTRLHTETPHANDVVFDLDQFGMPGPHFVQFMWTPEQVASRFGIEALYGPEEPLGPEDEQRKRRQSQERIRMLEVMIPRDPTQYSLSALLPREVMAPDGWSRFWVNTRTKTVVSGYTAERTPKYNTGRWSVSPGHRNGRGPGHTALPDTRMANRMAATLTRAGEKLVDPPFAVYNGSLVSPLRLFTAGITHIEGDRKPEPLLAAGSSRVDITDALLAAKQAAIREAFFTPLFLNPDSPVRSATEILQQVDERNRAVGPNLIRVQEEVVRRHVRRAIDLADIAGALGEVPDALAGVSLRMEYNSPLTASQAQMEALGTTRLFEMLMPWAQVDQSIMDGYDMDRVSEVAHAGSGAPANIRRSQSQIKALREQRAAAMEQQQAAAMAKEVGIPAASVAAQAARGQK